MTAAVIILGFCVLAHIGVTAWIDAMDEIPPEYNQCHGCLSGWCDCVPGDEECQKWREENGG